MKLVIEHVSASPVARPDLQGLSIVEKPKGRAKF